MDNNVKKMVNSAEPVSINDILNLTTINTSFGELMDKTRYRLLNESELYGRKNAEVERCEDAYMALNANEKMRLTDEQREVVDDYKSAIEKLNQTYADISYIAGFEDCVKLLKRLGLIQTEE